MSFLINSNKVMKINEENETLKSVLNDYLKYMTDFDCFSVNTASYGKGFIEASTHIDDESFNYNDKLESKLFDAVKASNDGSYIVEMSTNYSESDVKFCGSVKSEKVHLSDVSDETEWFTAMVPKLSITAPQNTKVEIDKILGEELATELVDDFDAEDEVEENGGIKYIYHMEKWCNFDKISLFEFTKLINNAIEIVKESGCSLSLVEEENKYITEDCSSYLEFKINDYGKLGFDVYKITKR